MSAEEVEKFATKDIVECTKFSEAIATLPTHPDPSARTVEVLHKLFYRVCVRPFKGYY